MRAIKNLLLGMGLCLALLGIPSSEQQSTYTVHGSVLDSATKQPIARALVQIAGGDAVLTDSNGQFEFSSVAAQEATLLVRRPGYVSNNSINSGSFVPSQDQVSAYTITISPGMAPLQFLLRPEGVLTGQVSLLGSDPADGIQVSAYRKAVENGRPMWKLAGIATTNTEGVFRIASLSSGRYLLYAQPTGELSYPAPSDSLSWGYPPVYFPGVTDPSAADVISLATGEHMQADATLIRQTFYPVDIKIASVQPGEFVSLEIHDPGGRPINAISNYDQQLQNARANLPAGRYVLDARGFIPGNRNQSFGRIEFTVSAAPANYLTVGVLPLRSIPITLRREFTAPDIGANSHLANPNPEISLNLVPADALFLDATFGNQLEPVPGSHDGTSFMISNVPPGRYWVEASANEGYISSITSGGVDVARDPLTLGVGGSSAPIEITLRNDYGSINGTISMTRGSTGETPHIRIYGIPLFATVSELPEALPDNAGQFTFGRLPPGSYRVVACDSPQEIEFQTPEGIAAWEGQGQVVSVEAGGAAHVQLDIADMKEQ